MSLLLIGCMFVHPLFSAQLYTSQAPSHEDDSGNLRIGYGTMPLRALELRRASKQLDEESPLVYEQPADPEKLKKSAFWRVILDMQFGIIFGQVSMNVGERRAK